MKLLTHFYLLSLAVVGAFSSQAGDYAKLVGDEKPIAYWRFNETTGKTISNTGSAGHGADGVVDGTLDLAQAGPRPIEFPDFDTNNLAIGFEGKDGFIRVKTSPENPLAFKLGDTITMEAWVNPNRGDRGDDIYIVGKGRTQNPGFAANNQNWALRLRTVKGKTHLNFLFRDARNLSEGRESWHRWTSSQAFVAGTGWHHVIVTYKFGRGDSITGYLDGAETSGKWDYGGKTDLGPIVDRDEVWIGSAQGGLAGSTFNGLIDEVAIYRGALSAPKIAQRFAHHALPPVAPKAPPVVKIVNPPTDLVHVQILETGKHAEVVDPNAAVGDDSGDPDAPLAANDSSWHVLPGKLVDEYDQTALGFVALPTKYSDKAIKLDRPAPFFLRAYTRIALPEGDQKILIRAHNASRLTIDGKTIATTPFTNVKHADAEEVPDQEAKSIEGVRILPPGHYDQLGTYKSDGKPHTIVFEVFVGGKKLRPEIGEACVAIEVSSKKFNLIAPKVKVAVVDEEWEPFAATQVHDMAERDVAQRRVVSKVEDKYWADRHNRAKGIVAQQPAIAVPAASAGLAANNAVDQFINQKIAAAKVTPTALLDDEAFLRRVTLDTTGVIPSPAQIANFKNAKSSDRRAKVIEKLMNDAGWADHWVPYWQDVLAENPGMLKPTLNNTGPFRWYIYDSFRDNKPFDRFMTELVSMEGSLYYGGAAGFAMASENDVPMAAKAQIVSKAFLGMELGCARCHDAPYHPFKQEQLFSMAAMLKRAPQIVPVSSSIPINTNTNVHRIVQVTLPPGSVVKPAWPFSNVVSQLEFKDAVRHAGDTREQLAGLITDPRDDRFPQVIANRIWKKYMGWGLVEPVDDWPAEPKVSHPELLKWLGREFVTSGYDVKHIARLILNSQAYQRAAKTSSMQVPEVAVRYFEAPARRRLTAEQMVDSLFVAVGKSLDSEELNQDADGRRPAADFNNLGIPKRAWGFCSLANERDRPALALPKAQAIVDTLMMFGWRESRPNPITVRDDSPNVLQPANIANSTLGVRVVRLSDNNALTQLALKNLSLPELIDATFARLLSRTPTAEEKKTFTDYLQNGYDQRRVANYVAIRKKSAAQTVSWSNHLNAQATKIKLDMEREARESDPPSPALNADWRERMEDVVWALVNSPEFVFVP